MRILALEKIKVNGRQLAAGRIGKYTTEKSAELKEEYGDKVVRISNKEWQNFNKLKAIADYKKSKKNKKEEVVPNE